MALVPSSSQQDPELVSEVKNVLAEVQNLLTETRSGSKTNKQILLVAIGTLVVGIIAILISVR